MNNHDFHLISEDCMPTADQHNHHDFYRSYQGDVEQEHEANNNNNNNNQQAHSQRRQLYHPQDFLHHKNQPEHGRRYLGQRKASLGFSVGTDHRTGHSPINMLTLANVNHMDYR